MWNPVTLAPASRARIFGIAILSMACQGGSDTVAPKRVPAAALQASLPSVPGAKDDIDAMVDAAVAAWSAKDASAYAALFATDVRWVNPLGGRIMGRDAFRAQHVFLFNGPFAGSTLTIAVQDVIFLTGTNAVVLSDASLTGYAFLPPGLPSVNGVVRMRSVWVVEKREGSWQIIYHQLTPY